MVRRQKLSDLSDEEKEFEVERILARRVDSEGNVSYLNIVLTRNTFHPQSTTDTDNLI